MTQQATELIATQLGSAISSQRTWGSIIVNVKDPQYGAVGDGVKDDTAAFNAAIAACPVNGVLYIPAPSVRYKLSSTLTINKSITIKGDYVHVGSGGAATDQYLQFLAGVLVGILVTAPKVKIEGISMFMNDTTVNVTGIQFNNGTVQFDNMALKDIFINFNGSSGIGVKFKNVITSTFTNVKTYQGAWGFWGEGTGTSITFINCWPTGTTGGGYHLENYYYCSFNGTACDSGNFPDYAYDLLACWAITFDGCGAEGMNKSFAKLDNCLNIVFTGCLSTGMNKSNTSDSTFCSMFNGTNNITFIGCWDNQAAGAMPNVNALQGVNPAFPPIIINCRFLTGFYDGSVTTKVTGAATSAHMIMGRSVLTENGSGSGVLTLAGRPFAGMAQRVGVLNSTASGWLGYFEVDGAIVPGISNGLPAANAGLRGKIVQVQGAAGVADGLHMCMKSATDTYSWKPIATG